MAETNADLRSSVVIYPAPWNLTGKGYFLFYQFPKDFASEEGRNPAFLGDSFAGGLGAVMIIDYVKSNAGPYGELLFIPGSFHFRGKRLKCITKIYVSTDESVVNGWENWAIPKEQAEFSFTISEHKRRGKIVITKDSELVIDISLKHGRISFPIHTSIIPFPLVQEKDGRLYYTNFIGKGLAHFAGIEELKLNPELFPDIVPYRPLMAMWMDNFSVIFPPSKIASA